MNNKFGNKLIDLRKKYNYSQEDVAFSVGTSRQVVSKWERGESLPDAEKLVLLSQLYNLSIDYLLDNEVKSTSVIEFIERLENASESKSYNITLEEIKIYISKFSSNFKLLHRAVEYLSVYCFENHNKELADYAIKYSLKLKELFNQNIDNEITLSEIDNNVVELFFLQERYQDALEYIQKFNLFSNSLSAAKCYRKIGNDEEALKYLGKNYIEAISNITNGAFDYLSILIKNKNYQLSLEYLDWLYQYVKSVSKHDKSFFNHVCCIILYSKALMEKILNKDYIDTLIILVDIVKNKLDNLDHTTDSIRFYSGPKHTLYSTALDINKTINEFNKNEALGIYEEVYHKYEELLNAEKYN